MNVRAEPNGSGQGGSAPRAPAKAGAGPDACACASADAAEARFRALFEAAGCPVALLDLAGRVLDWNRECERLTGWSRAEILGRDCLELVVPPPYWHALRDEMRRVADGEQLPHTVESAIVARDGTRTTLACRLTRLADAGNGRPGVLAIGQDVGDLRAAEAALRRALAEAQQARRDAEAANRAKDRFLAVLSHELRAPLTPVLLIASSLEKHPALPPELRADVTTLLRQVELEARLIDDLLDLHRIGRGTLAMTVAEVDVHELLRRVAALAAPDAAAKGLAVALDLRAARPGIPGDEARLHQVFSNLLANALKFTPAGGSVRLTTADADANDAGAGDDGLVVEVQDTGIGIAPEVLPRLFAPFEQGEEDTARIYGGLGLGLSIGRSIVELHGGTIEARSAGRGRGATFRVTLPRRSGAAASVAAAARSSADRAPHGPVAAACCAAPASPAAGQRHPSRRRVLVVDDHALTLELLGRLLRRMGYDVILAGTVDAALRAAAENPFDCLLSDIALPDGSGTQLLAELNRRLGRRVRAVALSGLGTEDHVRASRDAGFLAHLVKPIDVDRLQLLMRELAG